MEVQDVTELRLLVRDVLDEAIASVAEEEFNRLCNALNNDFDEVARRVRKALRALRRLQGGVEPEYNEWEALFYLTWYQPRQINLALYILEHHDLERWPLKRHEIDNRRSFMPYSFHVIDVGCGALAVQFAMPLVAAKYQIEGNDLFIRGIDPSEPMKRIGNSLWSKFRSLLGTHTELSDLSHICDQFTNNCELFDSHASCTCSEHGRFEVPYDEERYPAEQVRLIAAVHAVYDSNQFKIKRALQELHDRYSFFDTVVTSHILNEEVVKFVCDAKESRQFRKPGPQDLVFQGQLPKTTEWRTELFWRLPTHQISSVRGLLSAAVRWAARNHYPSVMRIPTLEFRRAAKL